MTISITKRHHSLLHRRAAKLSYGCPTVLSWPHTASPTAVQVLPVSRRRVQAGRAGRSFRDLELPVVDAIPNIAVDSGCVDLVPSDLATSELAMSIAASTVPFFLVDRKS